MERDGIGGFETGDTAHNADYDGRRSRRRSAATGVGFVLVVVGALTAATVLFQTIRSIVTLSVDPLEQLGGLATVVLSNVGIVPLMGPVLGTVVAIEGYRRGWRPVLSAAVGAGGCLVVVAGILAAVQSVLVEPFGPVSQYPAPERAAGVVLVGLATVATTGGVGILASRVASANGDTTRSAGGQPGAGVDGSQPREGTEDRDSASTPLTRTDETARPQDRWAERRESVPADDAGRSVGPTVTPVRFGGGIVALFAVVAGITVFATVFGVESIAGDRFFGPDTESFVAGVLFPLPFVAVLVGTVAGLVWDRSDAWKSAVGATAAWGTVLATLLVVDVPYVSAVQLEFPDGLVLAGTQTFVMGTTVAIVAVATHFVAGHLRPNLVARTTARRIVGSSNVPRNDVLALFAGVFVLGRLAGGVSDALGVSANVSPGSLFEVLLNPRLVHEYALILGLAAGVVYALVADGPADRLGVLAATGSAFGYAVLGGLSTLAILLFDPTPEALTANGEILYILVPLVTVPVIAGVTAALTGSAIRTAGAADGRPPVER